jgi:hypothetical protein
VSTFFEPSSFPTIAGTTAKPGSAPTSEWMAGRAGRCPSPGAVNESGPIDEIPELADLAAFLRAGGKIALPEKYRKSVTLLLDDEVIEHFKVGEDGWMERIDAAFRKAAGL